VDQTRRLLRAAERGALPGTVGGIRDRAVLTMLLFTGLRIAELAALNTSDVAISARKGLVTVRRGKGDRYRQVPLNAEARDTLDAWLAKRAKLPNSDPEALFLSLKGQRLSARAIDLAVRHLGQQADVETSAHTLRHLPDPARTGRQRHRPGRRARRTLPARDHPPLQPPQRRRPTGSHGRPHRRLLTKRQTAPLAEDPARLLLTPRFDREAGGHAVPACTRRRNKA